MTTRQASDLIAAAVQTGRLTREQARAAQDAIRARVYYGNRLTPRDRASILHNRFGL